MCSYKCLSPESLHTHYQVEHNNNSQEYAPERGKDQPKASDVVVVNPTRRSATGGDEMGHWGPRKGGAGLVVEPILAPSQRHQLDVLSGFAYFWVVVARGRWNLTDEMKADIFAWGRCDDYFSFLNFRTPEDYTKLIWPKFLGVAARDYQFAHQASDFVIQRSLTNLGVHPKHPFSSEVIDLGQEVRVGCVSCEATS